MSRKLSSLSLNNSGNIFMKQTRQNIWELKWTIPFHGLNIRPNKTNAIISEVRHHVDLKHSSLSIMQFSSHIYTILFWFGLTVSSLLRPLFISKEVSKANAVFPGKTLLDALFETIIIMKLQGKIALENCLFISKAINNTHPII